MEITIVVAHVDVTVRLVSWGQSATWCDTRRPFVIAELLMASEIQITAAKYSHVLLGDLACLSVARDVTMHLWLTLSRRLRLAQGVLSVHACAPKAGVVVLRVCTGN